MVASRDLGGVKRSEEGRASESFRYVRTFSLLGEKGEGLCFSLLVYVALTHIPVGGLFFSVYVALTNIYPRVNCLLTGFAMRSDPNVAFG